MLYAPGGASAEMTLWMVCLRYFENRKLPPCCRGGGPAHEHACKSQVAPPHARLIIDVCSSMLNLQLTVLANEHACWRREWVSAHWHYARQAGETLQHAAQVVPFLCCGSCMFRKEHIQPCVQFNFKSKMTGVATSKFWEHDLTIVWLISCLAAWQLGHRR